MKGKALITVSLMMLLGCREAEHIAYQEVQSSTSEGLQQYGDSLMQNKVGAIVAIDPSNGEILAMVSAPGVSSGLPAKYYPGYDRCKDAVYPAGTVFSLVNDIISIHDGVIDGITEINCDKGYRTDGVAFMPCHKHKNPVDLKAAVMMNCSSFAYESFKRVLENQKHESTSKGLEHWREMVGRLGFGYKLNPLLFDERSGYVPGTLQYDRTFGEGSWSSNTVLSLAIGEGDIEVTPLQLANFCAIIANHGLYYIPHVTREVYSEGENNGNHMLIDCGFAPDCFNDIIEGMWLSANSSAGEGGVGWVSHVEGLNVCAMPGKARNLHGEDNSVFIGFAPKDNPRIAIAVYVENGGNGASVAAPIGSLMIEKYLLGQTSRLGLESRVMKWNYLNRGIYKEQL